MKTKTENKCEGHPGDGRTVFCDGSCSQPDWDKPPFTASELRARIQKQVSPTEAYFKRHPDIDGAKEYIASQEAQRRSISKASKRVLITEWITKSCRFDKYGAGCYDIKEDRYSLRDDGRNPDGSGENYAERNL